MTWSLAPSFTGKGRKRIEFTTPKTAVFTPMPSANIATITTAKTGDFRSIRMAK